MNTDSKLDEALEPCPFCGVVPKMQTHTQEDEMDEGRYLFFIECGNGGCPMALVSTGGPLPSGQLAARIWNTRSRASVAVASTPPNELLTIPDIEKSVVPNHALIQLLESALLHPESAEGNIRQVIETLNTANDENKRLREHVADLNHDLEAAIKECDEQHGM